MPTTDAIGSTLGLTKKDVNPPKSEIDGKKIASDFQSFLRLLTTQLQNQDPTEPLDTNEFTNQLVLFSGVEQQLATNTNLEKLVAATAGGIQQGLGYIGKAVDAPGNKGVLVDGNAVFAYELPADAEKVEVSILDSRGQVVFSGNGAKKAGKNLVVWDGVNSLNQKAMPEGTYQIAVKAKNFKDEDIEVTTLTTGRVTSAEGDKDGNTLLSIGSEKINVKDILTVREIPTNTVVKKDTPAATASTSSTPASTSTNTTTNTPAGNAA
jgi:flagellar basal-body rod modification protein FlgD